MIPVQIRNFATRASRVAVFVLVSAALAVAACSSDPRSDLGSDLVASRPGVVFDDTLALSADTVLAYYTALASDTVLELGRVAGYERAMVVQISWTGASLDAGKTVESASFRLRADEVDGSFPARFYTLAEAYAEGDSLPGLDTLSVVVNPATGSPNRTLVSSTRENPLPIDLVQGWIRNEVARTALAVLYPDPGNDAIATFKALQAVRDRPQLFVTFVGGTSTTYRASGDATFVRPTTSTSNLVVADGYVRRVYFRLPLDQLAERSAIHNARVRLYIVPGATQSRPNLVVFIPASDDPTRSEFRAGQLVTTATYQASAAYVEFAMTNAVALMLQGTLENNGVVVRFDAENSELREVQFYGSSAPDSLRPRLFVTSSTPAEFRPAGSSR